MQKSLSTASYIFWGVLACLLGVVICASLFETKNHVAEATVLEEELIDTSPLTSQDTINPPTLATSADIQYFEKSDLAASIVQSRIEDVSDTYFSDVELIDSNLFNEGSCPQTEFVETPRYFAPLSRVYSVDDYTPSFLVEINPVIPTKNNRLICLDETTAVHLKELFDAAKADGYNIVVTSGYRSPHAQENLYNDIVSEHGTEGTLRVAEPGHSEHQLGTTLDLTTSRISYDSAAQSFGDTPEGIWLQEHAGKYGFIMSYPKDKQEETGYIYEPWHWRFVGIENVELMKK